MYRLTVWLAGAAISAACTAPQPATSTDTGEIRPPKRAAYETMCTVSADGLSRQCVQRRRPPAETEEE